MPYIEDVQNNNTRETIDNNSINISIYLMLALIMWGWVLRKYCEGNAIKSLFSGE